MVTKVPPSAPEAIWELSLSVWLLTRGFRPSPILTGQSPSAWRTVQPQTWAPVSGRQGRSFTWRA
jgi:hypothetical protein